MKKRKIIFCIFAIIVVFVSVIALCDVTVSRNASDKTYDNGNSIPHRKVGLILGTSPISTWNGRRNYYFDHRIKAGAELYKAERLIGSWSVAEITAIQRTATMNLW